MDNSGNTILITGGGSGIGAALASELHRAGNQVIVAGRRQGPLDELAAAHPGMIAMQLDITDAQAISGFAARLIAACPELNILVNNAGIMKFEDRIDLAGAEAMITTNLLGTIRLTAALLPHLMAQAKSTILNVSSGLAFVPLVDAPTYSATKSALHSWSVAIREQLRDTQIEVVELIPPAVRTELTPGQSDLEFAMPLDEFMAETMAQLRQKPTPEEVCGKEAQMLRSVVDAEKYDQLVRQIALVKP